MERLRVWFPGFYTEAHREYAQGAQLAEYLAAEGIFCTASYKPTCDLVFCGSIYKQQEVAKTVGTNGPPVIHYSWDIYPFQLERDPKLWNNYIRALKQCAEVWLPSESCRDRLKQYTGRLGHVIFPSIRFPAFNYSISPKDYVLDVVRKYPDPNEYAIRDACRRLSIPCVESGTALPWDKYLTALQECRLVASGQYEASTGGLSLLEAYWYGRPLLLSDSPRHGAKEYFKDRPGVLYFTWDDPKDLDKQLEHLWYYHDHFKWKPSEWIKDEFSEEAFAKRIAKRIWELLG